MLLRQLLYGPTPGLFRPHSFRQQSLTLGRLGPQLISCEVDLCLEGGILLAPLLNMVLDSLQYSRGLGQTKPGPPTMPG